MTEKFAETSKVGSNHSDSDCSEELVEFTLSCLEDIELEVLIRFEEETGALAEILVQVGAEIDEKVEKDIQLIAAGEIPGASEVLYKLATFRNRLLFDFTEDNIQ